MLKKQLTEDLRAALKRRVTEKVSVLRILLSEIKNKEIEKQDELEDEEVLEVLADQAKRRKEAAEQFAEGGRKDLADKESRELEMIEDYLPEQLGEDELRKEVRNAIEEIKAGSPSDMGKVMGKLMPRLKGRVEGAKLSALVKKELNKHEQSNS